MPSGEGYGLQPPRGPSVVPPDHSHVYLRQGPVPMELPMKARFLSVIAFGLALGAVAFAQDAAPAAPAGQSPQQGGGWQGRRGGGWGQMGEGRGVIGAVTEVAADHYTIKTEAGDLYTVHYSANTRIVKAPPRPAGAQRGSGEGRGEGRGEGEGRTPPQPIKATDIKVGDVITAGGEVDANAKSVGAVMIMQLDPERVKQMREMEANFGKTWLMGKVTGIDGVKVTLQGGPGNAAHSFVADENTTFRKRRDPITLGDIQVGDSVRVEGALKDGSFIATNVAVMGMQGPPPGAPPAGQPAAAPPK
jgi:hypothetical protein